MALDIFKPKAPPLFGMDISSSAIKMVELAEAGKGSQRVDRYAIEPLAKDSVLDGNISNLESVAETVRRAWKKLGTRTKNVALALPTAAVITKKIICPAGLREEDLELQVESEANQYIPFALDEVNLDFQVLGPAPSGEGEVEVLIAASRKEKVEDRVAVAEAAGLKALVMDVESYAMQTAFELVRQQLATLPAHTERIDLTVRPVQGEHQLPPQALPIRVNAENFCGFRDHHVVSTEDQPRLDRLLDRTNTQLLQPGRLQPHELGIVKIGEHLTAQFAEQDVTVPDMRAPPEGQKRDEHGKRDRQGLAPRRRQIT